MVFIKTLAMSFLMVYKLPKTLSALNFLDCSGIYNADRGSASTSGSRLVVAERVIPAGTVLQRVDLDVGRRREKGLYRSHDLLHKIKTVFASVVAVVGRVAGVDHVDMLVDANFGAKLGRRFPGVFGVVGGSRPVEVVGRSADYFQMQRLDAVTAVCYHALQHGLIQLPSDH